MKNTKLSGLVSLINFFNSPASEDITNWMSRFGGVVINESNSIPCLEIIKKVRSGSVCSVCSGRSARWFAGEKALFSSEYCQPILGSCSASIKLLGNYNERARFFFTKLHNSNIGGLDVGGEGIKMATLIKQLDGLTSSMKNLDIFSLITEYEMKKNDEQTKNRFCNSIVTLVDDTFIKVSNKIYDLAAQYLTTWNTIAKKIGMNHINTAGNWVHKSRNLQSSSSIEFHSDVKVVDVHAKIDSSYTSYFGAIGTNKNENSNGVKALPLNLTAILP